MKPRDTFLRTLALWPLLWLPLPAAAETDAQPMPRSMVADSISVPVLDRDLPSRHPLYLEEMIDDPKKRREYIDRLYLDQKVEAAIVEQGLAQDQPLLEALRNARAHALLDALVRHRMDKSAADIAKLARERYTAHRDRYKTRKKIKLAVIFIKKAPGQEARARIQDILEQLQGDPDNGDLFHELAKQYSDDKKAEQGGINEKWLIAPTNLEERDPLMQASFALDTVGQMTGIVEIAQGFAIAKLMAVTPSLPISFDTARANIEREIQSELYYRVKGQLLESFQAPEDLAVDDQLLLQKIKEIYQAREAASTANEKGDLEK